MLQEISTKSKRPNRLIQRFSFILFGICAFYNPVDKWNPYNILFGILIGLLFGFLLRLFLNSLLNLFNRKSVKEKGKTNLRRAVNSGLLFTLPFAIMLTIATFYLNWSVARECICAGVMAAGTAAAIEMTNIKGKQQIRDTIVTSLVSFLFSFLWTSSFVYIASVPSVIQGAVTVVMANMK
ncbi:MAG TPA: hypothetical protein DDZ89_10690 [Clostridiales bacterium]|nr:hypothetical protein [Clostridiales bacterium]